MIDCETFSKIHDCHDRQGLDDRLQQTARTLGLDPKTVATWVARSRFEPRRSRPRGSASLIPSSRASRGCWTPTSYKVAQQIFQRLRRGRIPRWRDDPAGLRLPHPAYQAAGLSEAALRSRRVRAEEVDWGALWNHIAVGNTRRRAFVFRHGAGV